MSYYRDCKYCGRRIIMAEGVYAWQPMEPDGSGRHVCGSGVTVECEPTSTAAPVASIGEWTFATLKTSVTYLTRCWRCDEEVFFHRAENGGCVLFDNLEDRPWAVHSCWQDHAAEQRQGLEHYRNGLVALEFNGRFYHRDRKVYRYRSGHPISVRVSGYVSDNYALYDDQGPPLVLRSARAASTAPLVRVEVADSEERVFRFLLPSGVAEKLPDFQLVTIHGEWMQRGRRWLLFASRVESLSYSPDDTAVVEGVPNLADRMCSYCGVRMAGTQGWGLDPEYALECAQCGSVRRSMSPAMFVRHCRTVSRRCKVKQSPREN